jgi:hypothetical protein
MQKYILDSLRNSITSDPDNSLMEFVEMAGKGIERPISYAAIERTFYSLFLHLKPLETPLNYLDTEGKNPRYLERRQLAQLMNIYAKEIIVGRWDSDTVIAKLEYKVQQGATVPEKHLIAHRMTREEIMHATLEYVALVIKNFYAYTGQHLDEDKLLQTEHPVALWDRIAIFMRNLRGLPCWADKNLSGTVFGSKTSRDYWINIYKTGVAGNGTRVLAESINLQKMISL